MRLLITGKGGQLGRALEQSAPAQAEVHALDRAGLDIGDEAAVRHAVLRIAPDIS